VPEAIIIIRVLESRRAYVRSLFRNGVVARPFATMGVVPGHGCGPFLLVCRDHGCGQDSGLSAQQQQHTVQSIL